MAQKERIEKLKNILMKTNGSAIKDLAIELEVTEMTVRRDLKKLIESGDAVLLRGVAVYRPKAVSVEAPLYSIREEKEKMSDEKERIGKAAAALLEPGDVVFLDVGTTVERMAASIEKNMHLTAVCFAFNTMVELQKKNLSQIIMGGGYYHPTSEVFESEAMVPIMNGLRATKAFIAPSACDMDQGLTCPAQYDKTIKRLEINNSKKRILLITSQKFDTIKSTAFASWDEIDQVITDSGIPDRWKKFLSDKGIEVKIV